MCKIFLLYLTFGLLLIGYTYWRVYRRIVLNFDVITGFLEGAQIDSTFLHINMQIQGQYKGKKLVFTYSIFGNNSLFLEFQGALKLIKLYYDGYPRPTIHTQLRGNKIFYAKNSQFQVRWGNVSLYTLEDLSKILKEIDDAVKVVEGWVLK